MTARRGWAAVRRLGSDAGGSSAVEFAIVAPVLIALFAGIVVFGLYLGAMSSLRQLAAEAARASVAGVTDAERAQAEVLHQRPAGEGGFPRALGPAPRGSRRGQVGAGDIAIGAQPFMLFREFHGATP